MNRRGEFRGKCKGVIPKAFYDNGWVYGYYFADLDEGEFKDYIFNCPLKNEVITKTVTQYTGVRDKNGTMIYEGDIIEYYSFCEQIEHTEPHIVSIDRLLIKKHIDFVSFKKGIYSLHEYTKSDEFPYIPSLIDFGFKSLDEVRVELFGNDYKKHFTREDLSADADGTEINNDILGIKVIGNIFDNKDLIKKNE